MTLSLFVKIPMFRWLNWITFFLEFDHMFVVPFYLLLINITVILFLKSECLLVKFKNKHSVFKNKIIDMLTTMITCSWPTKSWIFICSLNHYYAFPFPFTSPRPQRVDRETPRGAPQQSRVKRMVQWGCDYYTISSGQAWVWLTWFNDPENGGVI